jgi:hypothetical protein
MMFGVARMCAEILNATVRKTRALAAAGLLRNAAVRRKLRLPRAWSQGLDPQPEDG